ncbi:hypothetical protein HIC20_02630, partial [Buchnera aphidicola (Hormaphis cornu)]
ILVKEGDLIVKEQGLITVEGQKASMEIPSEYSGIIHKIQVKVGDKVKKGSSIVILKESDNSHINSSLNTISQKILKEDLLSKKSDFIENDINQTQKTVLIHASPLVRRLSYQLNINLNKVKGSGKKNRVLKNDLYEYLNRISLKNKFLNNKSILNTQEKDPCSMQDKFGIVEIVSLSKVQQITALNVYKSWSSIPHVTHFDKADITDLEKFRNSINKNKLNSIKHGKVIKLTILVFLIKIVVNALKKFPIFNSSLSNDNRSLVLKKYFNIGIAIDTNHGLFVPVLKNLDKKNIIDISKDLSYFSNKTKQGKLNLINMEDGCFTISNLGGFGGLNFTPIIKSPEVAILGVSKHSIESIWKNDRFIPRLMLPLSLSYDHRVINGVDAVRFMNYISESLSDIRLLAIE